MLITQSCPTVWDPRGPTRLWVGKNPWRREWLHTLVFLHGEFHGQRSLAGYNPWGLSCIFLSTQLFLQFWKMDLIHINHSTNICTKWTCTKWADVYSMLKPTVLLATLVHVTWSHVPAGNLGVWRLRMSISRERTGLFPLSSPCPSLCWLLKQLRWTIILW